jgi:hypothetical protein
MTPGFLISYCSGADVEGTMFNKMHVPLFIQLMQLIVLHRCCGDGMSCHAHAELRAANKQCVKLPSRVESSKHVTSGSHGTNLGEFVDDSNR